MFSYLEEVWGDNKEEQFTQEQDDIIGAYIEGQTKPDVVRHAPKTTRYDMSAVDGYTGASSSFFDVDKYYEQDVKSLQSMRQQESVEDVIKDTMEIADKKQAKKVIETFDQNQNFTELLIFLMCGVLLILMLDKVANLTK